LLNGESGPAELATPPAIGLTKPAGEAPAALAMSRASASSIRAASAVSQNSDMLRLMVDLEIPGAATAAA
jgi:hypothetical protein